VDLSIIPGRWPRHGTLWRCLRGGVVIKTMMMSILVENVLLIAQAELEMLQFDQIEKNIHRN